MAIRAKNRKSKIMSTEHGVKLKYSYIGVPHNNHYQTCLNSLACLVVTLIADPGFLNLILALYFSEV